MISLRCDYCDSPSKFIVSLFDDRYERRFSCADSRHLKMAYRADKPLMTGSTRRRYAELSLDELNAETCHVTRASKP